MDSLAKRIVKAAGRQSYARFSATRLVAPGKPAAIFSFSPTPRIDVRQPGLSTDRRTLGWVAGLPLLIHQHSGTPLMLAATMDKKTTLREKKSHTTRIKTSVK